MPEHLRLAEKHRLPSKSQQEFPERVLSVQHGSTGAHGLQRVYNSQQGYQASEEGYDRLNCEPLPLAPQLQIHQYQTKNKH